MKDVAFIHEIDSRADGINNASHPFPDPNSSPSLPSTPLPPHHSAVTTKPQTAPSAVPSVPILDSDSCPEKPPQASPSARGISGLSCFLHGALRT